MSTSQATLKLKLQQAKRSQMQCQEREAELRPQVGDARAQESTKVTARKKFSGFPISEDLNNQLSIRYVKYFI